MYFADMYCYGESRNIVGITGIRGCMGFVYIGDRTTYGLHVPPDKATVVIAAGKEFSDYIKNNEAKVGKGVLMGFINGKNRPVDHPEADISGEEELALLKKSLKSPKTTLYRINKHLGSDSGGFGADSVAILTERTHVSPLAPNGCLVYYKRNDDITWVAGGVAAVRAYSASGTASRQAAKVPNDLRAGWRLATSDNAGIAKI